MTLEELLRAWQTASDARRKAAFATLRGEEPTSAPDDRRIRRWHEAARELGVCVRTLRTWAQDAQLRPVKLPGRKRTYGLRASDLEKLIEVHR